MGTTATDRATAHLVDEDLQYRVRLDLALKRPELGRILVRADKGTVRLSGPVNTFYLRQLAISVVSHVAGVRHIVDEIEVPESR